VGKARQYIDVALIYTDTSGACLYEVDGRRVRTLTSMTDAALAEIEKEIGDRSQVEWMAKAGLAVDYKRPLTGEILALDRPLCDAKPGYYVFVGAIGDIGVLAVADTDQAGDYIASGLLITLPLMMMSEFIPTGTAVAKAERL
jgi:hypothetical protein